MAAGVFTRISTTVAATRQTGTARRAHDSQFENLAVFPARVNTFGHVGHLADSHYLRGRHSD